MGASGAARRHSANMRVLCLTLLVLVPSLAQHLMHYDEIERLVGDYMRDTLAPEDAANFRELAEVLSLPNNFVRNGIDDYSQPRMTVTCLLCRSIFRNLIDLVNAGATNTELTIIITNLCVSLNIQKDNVCHGVIATNIPIIAYIIRQNPSVSPNTFCGLLFQTVDIASCPFLDERFEFQVTLPPLSADTVPPTINDNSNPITIALISDAHVDPLYKPYGSGDCGEPTCCRVGQTDVSAEYDVSYDDSFLANGIYFSGNEVTIDLELAKDIRKAKQLAMRNSTTEPSGPAGYWGDYRSCDTPLWAFEDILDQIKDNHHIDVVYYIGDTIDHGVWETSIRLINNMNNYLAIKLNEAFGDVPIFPVIGNHESQPTNQFAPSSITDPQLETHWLYEALTEQWGRWLDDGAKETLLKGGYYTAVVKPGLRVIGINTNIAYKYNWWIVHDPQDSLPHLQWLADTLYAAEQAGERVHILSHIPPGVHDLTKVWTREYNRIISRFSSIITAEFNGHTHSDEFKVYYSNTDGSPINVAWNAGAMTSYTYYNVNYKILTVDSNTFMPLDIQTYMYNLTEANLTPNQRPNWYQLYDFKETYGVTDLSAEQIDNLIYRMVTTEKNLLDTYTSYFHKLSPRRMECDDICKIGQLCKAVVTELWERQKCEEITQLFNNTSVYN